MSHVQVVIQTTGRTNAGSAWSSAGAYRNLHHTVYLVHHGTAAIALDGTWHRLRAGWIYAIPGHHQVQRRVSRGGFDHSHINFNLAAFSRDLHLGRLDHPLAFDVTTHEPWVATLQRVGAATVVDGTPVAIAMEGLLLQIIAAMHEAAGAAPPPAATDGPVGRALLWLDEHYRERPSLTRLARVSDCSPAHLHERFSAAIGRTPTSYALDRRMREVEHLLATTALPIADVATRVGYPDALHFSRVVRRYFHLSPRALRVRIGQTPLPPVE